MLLEVSKGSLLVITDCGACEYHDFAAGFLLLHSFAIVLRVLGHSTAAGTAFSIVGGRKQSFAMAADF